MRSVLPHDLEGNGIEFQNTGVVALSGLHADGGAGVGIVVTGPAAVVEHEDVAGTGQTVGNHVGMMLTDDPAEGVFRMADAVVGADLPHDLAGFLADDEDDVGFAAVHDDVVGMEAFITGIIPFVGSEGGHGVDVHPVAETGSAVDEGTAAVVGVTGHGVAGGFGEAHFLHMIGGLPFPDDFPFPVHFVDDVVEQGLVGNVFAVHVTMAEHQGVAGHGLGFMTGSIVTGGAAFTLEVVMLTGHPLGLFTRIFNEFRLIEFPDNVAVPVHLNEVDLVLQTVLGIADATAAEQIAAGEDLVRETVHALPELDFLTVHVDEHGTLTLDGHDGIAIPGLFRIVERNAGRIDCRMTHDKTPS